MALNFLTRMVGQFRSQPVFSLISQSRHMAGEGSVNDIKFENLKGKLLNGDITLVDVREPAELKDDGRIPKSLNIPLGQVEEAFKLPPSEFLSKYGVSKPNPESSDLVVSCRSGKRATSAFEKLKLLGYKNALVYTGSFQDWVKNGGPVEK
ncbi:rhodanese domain-containing protein CG4456-like [Stegodyphus dumicola]|uniref:rhodanese domain-containing protein CG4456-like n=1 Tax=Stegodyphus dumicola TaxID=202533 RepID=UPI0015AC9CF4|nr:rhodanese domain-containing protein CG4456-like [Stegodyphus dumicola]